MSGVGLNPVKQHIDSTSEWSDLWATELSDTYNFKIQIWLLIENFQLQRLFLKESLYIMNCSSKILQVLHQVNINNKRVCTYDQKNPNPLEIT